MISLWLCAVLAACNYDKVNEPTVAKTNKKELAEFGTVIEHACQHNIFDNHIRNQAIVNDLENGIIYFSGSLKSKPLEYISKYLINTSVNTVVIRSTGGFLEPTFDFISEIDNIKDTSVFIAQYCGSACNKFITAFDNIILCDNAVISFHSSIVYNQLSPDLRYVQEETLRNKIIDRLLIGKFSNPANSADLYSTMVCSGIFTKTRLRSDSGIRKIFDDDMPSNWIPDPRNLINLGFDIILNDNYDVEIAIEKQSQNLLLSHRLRRSIGNASREVCEPIDRS